MKKIRLHDKTFQLSVSQAEIERHIREVARQLNQKYKNNPTVPLCIGILNGAFMFTAELVKLLDFTCEVTFVKLSSYRGLESAGKVTELIGLNSPVEGRDIIVIEDIVETGNTVEEVHRLLMERNPSSVRFATLFYKPEAYEKNIPIDYYALKLPNDFVIGYGLDYDRLGRNLKDVYTLVTD